jgi:hypothetical protein
MRIRSASIWYSVDEKHNSTATNLCFYSFRQQSISNNWKRKKYLLGFANDKCKTLYVQGDAYISPFRLASSIKVTLASALKYQISTLMNKSLNT